MGLKANRDQLESFSEEVDFSAETSVQILDVQKGRVQNHPNLKRAKNRHGSRSTKLGGRLQVSGQTEDGVQGRVSRGVIS